MHESSDFFVPRWRPVASAVLCAIGVLVLVSLAIPAGNVAWRELDRSVFHLLNGLLAEGGGWVTFWAWANYRPVDLLSALLLLAFLVLPGPVFQPAELRRALFGFLALVVLGLLIRQSLDELAEVLGLVGPSPSLLYEPVYRLSELAPDLGTKDHSKESFPGDHAAVLLTWAFYMLARGIGPGSLAALVLAFLLILPRLVAGAHAVSDVLVGGVFVAGLTMGLGYCSPYHGRASAWLTARLTPLIDWFGRTIPGLAWFSFFRVSGSE